MSTQSWEPADEGVFVPASSSLAFPVKVTLEKEAVSHHSGMWTSKSEPLLKFFLNLSVFIIT